MNSILPKQVTQYVQNAIGFITADGENVGQNKNAGTVAQKNLTDSSFETATLVGSTLSLAFPGAAIVPAGAQIIRGVSRVLGTAFSQATNGVHVGDAQEYKSGATLAAAGMLALIPGYELASIALHAAVGCKDFIEGQLAAPLRLVSSSGSPAAH